MDIYYSSKFKRSFKKLSPELKKKLEEKEEIIKKDIFDKSLKTHKLNGTLGDFYAFSIDYKNRVIFEIIDNTILFSDVGSHDIY